MVILCVNSTERLLEKSQGFEKVMKPVRIIGLILTTSELTGIQIFHIPRSALSLAAQMLMLIHSSADTNVPSEA